MTSVKLVTGHSERSPGARNLGPTTEPEDDLYEWQFNKPLVARTVALLRERGIVASAGGYLPGGGNVARWNGASDLLVELHCNAFNRRASGTEVLYARGSARGRACAGILQRHLVDSLRLPNRRVKSIAGDRLPSGRWRKRGAYLLWGVRQVALIPEPFFIDNDEDLARAREVDLAAVYADAIAECVGAVFNKESPR